MEISEVDRRFAEFGALIRCQPQLVRQFAMFVLDSLHESVLLATQSLHRTRSVALLPAEWTGGKTPMTAQDDAPNLIGKIGIDEVMEEQHDNLPPAQETSDGQENGPSMRHFDFQPLIEEEKNEFVNSLNARGKQILAELQGGPRVAAIHGWPIAAADVQGTEFAERLKTA